MILSEINWNILEICLLLPSTLKNTGEVQNVPISQVLMLPFEVAWAVIISKKIVKSTSGSLHNAQGWRVQFSSFMEAKEFLHFHNISSESSYASFHSIRRIILKVIIFLKIMLENRNHKMLINIPQVYKNIHCSNF